MNNKLKKGDGVPYAQIANEILRYPTLSLKAKGLYAYMYSMSDNWNFTASSMALQLKENRKTILSIMNELKEFGLLEYEKLKSGKGVYTIFSVIKPINKPKSENGTMPKNSQSPKMPPCKNATVQKVDCIKNKDTIKNKDFNKNPNKGQDCKSFFKSNNNKLNLTNDEYEYRQKLYNSDYVGFITRVIVEGKDEGVYIDSSRNIYTDSRSSKQIVTSTLTEIYKQLHQINEMKKRANPEKLAKTLSKLKGK